MSQAKDILTYLKTFKNITSHEARLIFGCDRLASRIFELRELGHKITTTRFETETGARPARYIYNGDTK